MKRTTNKVIGVILTFALLFNVFTLMAFASTTDGGHVIELKLQTDKETYAPGDELKLSFYGQSAADCPQIKMAGTYAIGYPSAAVEPYSDSEDLNAKTHGFACDPDQEAEWDESMSLVMFHDTIISQAEEVDAGAPWDKLIVYGVAMNMSQGFKDSVAAPIHLFDVKMKIKADAAPGQYTIGFNKHCWDNYLCYVETNSGDVIGEFANDGGGEFSETYAYALNNVTFTVADPASTGPVVEKASTKGTEVKFTTNAPGADGVDDEFKLRIRSQISDADWDTYFAQTATGDESKNAITEVGVVAYQGTDGFDAETAKKVVNGEPTEKYESAGTNYIQKAGESDDAYFGAIIELKHSTCDYDITFMGYAKYLDAEGQPQVAFYKTSEVAKVSTNYDSAVSAFKAL